MSVEHIRRLFVVQAHQDVVIYKPLHGHVLHAVHRANAVRQGVEILHIVRHALALTGNGYGHGRQHIRVGFNHHRLLQIGGIGQGGGSYPALNLVRHRVHIRIGRKLQTYHRYVVVGHRRHRLHGRHIPQRLLQHRRDVALHDFSRLTRVHRGYHHIRQIHIRQKVHVRIEHGDHAQHDDNKHHNRNHIRPFNAESSKQYNFPALVYSARPRGTYIIIIYDM